MGPGDTPLYLSSAPSYRSIQNMPFERYCSSCCAGVRSNTACSARCSTVSSELTAHQLSNLNASTAPPLSTAPPPSWCSPFEGRDAASPPLTAICRCIAPGNVLWSLGLITVFGCMSFAVGAYLLSFFLIKTGLEQEQTL